MSDVFNSDNEDLNTAWLYMPRAVAEKFAADGVKFSGTAEDLYYLKEDGTSVSIVEATDDDLRGDLRIDWVNSSLNAAIAIHSFGGLINLVTPSKGDVLVKLVSLMEAEVLAKVIRIIEDPSSDDEFVLAASEEIGFVIGGAYGPTIATDTQNKLVIEDILRKSSDPVAKRAIAALDAYRAATVADGRLRAQLILSELGLGKLGGVNTDSLMELDSINMTRVLLRVVGPHIKQMPTNHGQPIARPKMYCILEKGVNRAAFDAWFDELCVKHSWNAAALDFSIWAVKEEFEENPSKEVTSDLFNRVFEPSWYVGKVDKMKAKGVSFNEIVEIAVSAPSAVKAKAWEFFKAQPHRSITEILADPDASRDERISALIAECEAGTDPTRKELNDLLSTIDREWRLFLVSFGPEAQKFFHAALLSQKK